MRGRIVSAPACELSTIAGPDTLDRIQATLERFWAGGRLLPPTARCDVLNAAHQVGGDIVKRAGVDGGWLGRPVRLAMAVLWFPNLVQLSFTEDGRAVDAVAMPLPAGRLHCHRNGLGNHWTVLLRPFDRDSWRGQATQCREARRAVWGSGRG